jgi:hypothetical protein
MFESFANNVEIALNPNTSHAARDAAVADIRKQIQAIRDNPKEAVREDLKDTLLTTELPNIYNETFPSTKNSLQMPLDVGSLLEPFNIRHIGFNQGKDFLPIDVETAGIISAALKTL